MRFERLAGTLLFCLSTNGCANVPSLPPDSDMPIKEILLHSACELRSAFHELDARNYPGFDAKKWVIGISLTPKVNSEGTISVGTTGKSTTDTKKRFFNTFVLGAAPGAAANQKGHSDGSITYIIRSKALLDAANHPLNCGSKPATGTPLARHLQIQDWLVRSVAAGDSGIGGLTKIDKPTYTAEIYVKFNGSGSYTYNFPFGTAFAGASASYDKDEILSIALTPDQTPKVITVRTLPSGGVFGQPKANTVITVIGQEPSSRLDEIQLEQSLRNLQIQTQ